MTPLSEHSVGALIGRDIDLLRVMTAVALCIEALTGGLLFGVLYSLVAWDFF